MSKKGIQTISTPALVDVDISIVLSNAYKIAVDSYNLEGILQVAKLMEQTGIRKLKARA